MNILMIGGTGVISTDIAELSILLGHEVYLLNRGNRPLPKGAHGLQADVQDYKTFKHLVQGLYFDVVADFISFTPEQLLPKLEILRGHYGQYVFISSVAVYDRGYGQMGMKLSAIEPTTGSISEDDTPTANFGWDYGRNKIACEHELLKEQWLYGSCFTVVRPGETYNRRRIPGTFVCDGKWYTQIDRIRRGKPIIVHDDGSARCPFTHAEDFARAFVRLYKNPAAYGQAFHITTQELITWKEAAHIIAQEAGAEANICYIPSETLIRIIPRSCLGDTYGMLGCSKRFDCKGYDNSKLLSVVPDFKCRISFREGMRRVIAYYDTHPEECDIDHAWNDTMDKAIATAQRFPESKN